MSNPSSAHTPTPWACRGQSIHEMSEHTVSVAYCGMVAGAGVCKDGKVRSFGVDQDTANANAAFIVEAVNSHASLKARIAELEANEKAYEEIIGKKTFQEVADRIRELAEALETAKGALHRQFSTAQTRAYQKVCAVFHPKDTAP
jgi:hypothetical protein